MKVKFVSRWYYVAGAFVLAGILMGIAWQSEPHEPDAYSSKISFKKHILSREYISEGVAVADVNRDGRMDVLSGTFWWEAPHWVKHELTEPEINATISTYGNSFLNFSQDINRDGWMDYIIVGFPGREAFWYENPKNKEGHWKKRVIHPSVGNEAPMLVDVDGDGSLDLLCNDPTNKKVLWISPPLTPGDTAWTSYVISSDSLTGTHRFTHGLGFGDMNNDGRKDVVITKGWWEAPPDRKQSDWKFHPAPLGKDCAEMYVFDVDGDGDNDVISSSAHNYGIWWHEQSRSGDSTVWIEHEIHKSFSQSHGLAFADINGDGNPDLITGKRFWAHNGHDPGAREPAVLYWFEFTPGKNPKWIPHLIDDRSGVGLHVTIQDINADRRPDIIVGNKGGIYVFEQINKR